MEQVRNDNDLDELFRDILKYHWIDEAQHAKADSVLIDEIASGLSDEDREKAIDEFLELGGAVDGLLGQQVEIDIEALEKATGRTLSEDDKEEVRTHQRRAYRWALLVSGPEHTKFVRIVDELTTDGCGKIAGAAQALAV
jgi:hypothetical protein